jgi:DNA repair protein RadA/Sms
MSKPRSVFVCQSCGVQQTRWLGRCPDCQEWNTLVEERVAVEMKGPARVQRGGVAPQPEPITAVAPASEERSSSGIGELDRVLGGGVVPGSVVLIGGDPGIGKSTLVLQALAQLAKRGPALYVSGEESPQQIKMRADRLGIAESQLLVLAETSVEALLDHAHALRPVVLAVDSIQTVFTGQLTSTPGSIGQVRESAAQIVQFAKQQGLASILVGHVTKEGAFAGPRVLEHMVDTVLYFEGDRGHSFRILRAVKNRFGSTNEIGVFEMKESGLQAVANPSALFLAERPVDVPARSSSPASKARADSRRPRRRSSRRLARRAAAHDAGDGSQPRRPAGGDPQERRVAATGNDIFLNVAGGVHLDEPAADLGAVLAVASSFLNRPVDPHTLLAGEVGLAGEVRAIAQAEARVREGAKLGFKRCVLPESSRRQLAPVDGVEMRGVASLNEAWELLF